MTAEWLLILMGASLTLLIVCLFLMHRTKQQMHDVFYEECYHRYKLTKELRRNTAEMIEAKLREKIRNHEKHH